MTRQLKVYGWLDMEGSRQVRCIVAATSQAAAARDAGYKAPHQMFNLSETGNAEEIEAALAEPDVALWDFLDTRPHDWKRKDG